MKSFAFSPGSGEPLTATSYKVEGGNRTVGDAGCSATAVVIVHWNRPDECRRTVEAFWAQGVPLDVIVVDNGSRPECLDRLIRSLSGAHVIRLLTNVGWGPAVNIGLSHWLAHSGHEWVLVAPHDALPQPGCLARLFGELDRRPLAGIACAEYGLSLRPAYGWLRGAQCVTRRPGHGWEAVPFPHGTLMAFRRDMLRQIGLFDERYFAYGEETEFGYRARRGGWEVGQVWGAVVSNPIRQATARLTWYLLARNSLLNVYQISGLVPACVRTLATLAGALKGTIIQGPDGCTPKLRLRAIKDFWAGKLGPPPEDLFAAD
jgi:GT2 family glycosyltransferase